MGALCLVCATTFLTASHAVAQQESGGEQKTTASSSKEASDKAYRSWLDGDCCGIVSDPDQSPAQGKSSGKEQNASFAAVLNL